ncbi:MAG: hypothetical protein ACI4RD_06715 [Kiritimatiellia bacterium]
MTAKTIAMAVIAAMGLAAHAGVVEVKFTVKTDVNDKVTSKAIWGLCNQETGEHVFWTQEKLPNEKGRLVNTNVAIPNTYFGLVNDTLVTRYVGQNAELIWGDNDENVLVAGAWGSEKSKSGQVAGIFNAKPATGTWTAKLNTTKTYAELLAKNKVEQSSMREQGVIDGIKDSASESVAEAEAKAAEEIAKAKAEADAALAAKDAELAQAANEMNALAEAFKTIDDPDMPAMFSEYLDGVTNSATQLKADAQAYLDRADEKLAAYKAALDVSVLEAAVEAAKADLVAASNALAVAESTVADLTTTNNMIAKIDEGPAALNAFFDARKQAKQDEIDAKQGELDAARAGFVAYTNELVTVSIPTAEANLAAKAEDADAAQAVMDAAKAALDEAQAALDGFVEPTVENGGLKTFEVYCEENGLSVDEVTSHEAYEAYKQATIAAAKQALTDARDAKQAEYAAKKADFDEAADALTAAQAALKSYQDALAAAIASGTTADITALEAELAQLQADLAKIDEELAFWQAFSYSDNDRAAFAAKLVEAEADRDAKAQAITDAEAALTAAEQALADQQSAAATALAALEAEIGATLTDAEGNALPIAEIEAKVAEYEATYIGYRASAEATLAAVAGIREKLGL